ncbi:MAG: FtsX-like permease family protein [Nocardioidaceae bacterium]
MITLWLSGLLRRRRGRLIGIAAGLTLAVGLLAALGSFLAASQATMTSRAVREVPVDWQVEVASGTSPATVLAGVRQDPGTRSALPVTYARVPGFSATSNGSNQRTGSGVVLGLPSGYASTFPGEIRLLAGSMHGVLVAQQTAANLHVAPGSHVSVLLPGGRRPVVVTVGGVVDLPQANSLFQRVGAPPQSQPVAPPDNVLLVPSAQVSAVTVPLAKASPGAVTTQIHVLRSHALPSDPASAFTSETASAHNLEVRLAGGGRVGDNLGAALDASRQDALYAQVLFLFLGTPGAVLAGLVTAAVAGAGVQRRRREQSLLRTRGADRRRVLGLASLEAGFIAVLGVAAGLVAAAVVGRIGFGSAAFGSSGSVWGWFAAAGLVGVAIAYLTIVLPVRRDLKASTVASGRADVVRRDRAPGFARWGVDIVLLAIGVVVFEITSRNGYNLVLVPEGVPQISVSYWALAAPLLIWIGGGLFAWRLVDLLLRRGRRPLSAAFGALSGGLGRPVANGMSRQRRDLVRASVLLALAVSFAVSTATFNSTYQAQAAVDARLTNGADVSVTESPGSHVGPSGAAAIAKVPGVSGVEPLMHRFAYVGNDLQDMFGVRPSTIGPATSLQDAYFSGGTAAQLMSRLATTPNGVLVSDETVKDYQLHLGEQIRLRVQDAQSHRYVTVPFKYVGVVKEFPTAPKDSFFVTSATYLTQVTHSDAVGTFLVRTNGSAPAQVAGAVRSALGPSVKVTDISTVRGQVGSSLTSVDLHGLTRVELFAAGLLAAAAGGLVLALGLAERRRTFAIAAALGARGRQLSGFVVAEAVTVLVAGLAMGAVLGAALSQVLVKVLTGVFDPPPAYLSVPWTYILVVCVLVAVAILVSAAATVRWARNAPISVLRES